jgi:hypothetical protein
LYGASSIGKQWLFSVQLRSISLILPAAAHLWAAVSEADG